MKRFLGVPLCAMMAAVITMDDHSLLALVETAVFLVGMLVFGYVLIVSATREPSRSETSR